MALLGARKPIRFGQQEQMQQAQQYGAPVARPDLNVAPPMQDQSQQKFKPNVLGVIGDAMQVYGGGQATYMQGVRAQQERAEMMRQRAMQAEQERETDWQDYVRKEEYERANPSAPQPTEFERALGASGLPKEEQIRLMQDYARNRANPLQGVPYTDEQGNTGLQFIRPSQQNQQGGLAPIGGILPPKSKTATMTASALGNVGGSRLDSITAATESNNRDYANGRPVTSPKGARFAMQVMPATARDPGFGLRAANPSNAADMNRLGREYRSAMEQRYGGDYSKMWAAYNAGPGAVDNAIKKYGANWLSGMPVETKDYVRKNMRALRGK